MLLDWSKPGRIKQMLNPTWCEGVTILQDRGRDGHMNLHLKDPIIWRYDKNGAHQQEESTKLTQRRDYLLNFGVVDVKVKEIIVAVHPYMINGGSVAIGPVKIDPPFSGALTISVRMGYEDIELSELPWIISLSGIL